MGKSKPRRKRNRIIVKLVADLNALPEEERTLPGINGFYYVRRRNARMEGGENGKLRLRLYHPVLKRHVVFIEKKIK